VVEVHSCGLEVFGLEVKKSEVEVSLVLAELSDFLKTSSVHFQELHSKIDSTLIDSDSKRFQEVQNFS
jgi:hypothetical protein